MCDLEWQSFCLSSETYYLTLVAYQTTFLCACWWGCVLQDQVLTTSPSWGFCQLPWLCQPRKWYAIECIILLSGFRWNDLFSRCFCAQHTNFQDKWGTAKHHPLSSFTGYWLLFSWQLATLVQQKIYSFALNNLQLTKRTVNLEQWCQCLCKTKMASEVLAEDTF